MRSGEGHRGARLLAGLVCALSGCASPARTARPETHLPLEPAAVDHLAACPEPARALLLEQGLVLTEETFAQFCAAYHDDSGVPALVTTDALLHSYASVCQQMLREIEYGQAAVLERFAVRAFTLLASRAREREDGAEEAARAFAIGIALAAAGDALPVDLREHPLVAAGAGAAAVLRAGRSVPLAAIDTDFAVSRLAPRGWYAGSALLGRYFAARRFLELCTFRGDEAGRRAYEQWSRCLEEDPLLRADHERLCAATARLFGVERPGSRRSVLPSASTDTDRVLERTFLLRIEEGLPLSGVDLLAVGPFASPAGAALLDRVPEEISFTARPQSCLGRSLALLDRLQALPPPGAPDIFASAAWRRKQGATQLGAWAEFAAVRDLRGGLWTMLVRGGARDDTPWRVEPCPDLFTGLAGLCEQAAEVVGSLTVGSPIDHRGIAHELLEEDRVYRRGWRRHTSRLELHVGGGPWPEGREYPAQVAWVQEFLEDCAAAPALAAGQARRLARILSVGAPATEKLLRLAGICRRLAAIADRQAGLGEATVADDRVLRAIGAELGAMQGYFGAAWKHPRDDAPTSVVVGPVVDRAEDGGERLRVGLARPRAMYVLLPHRGRPTVYRGAVFAYREGIEAAGAVEGGEQVEGLAPPGFVQALVR